MGDDPFSPQRRRKPAMPVVSRHHREIEPVLADHRRNGLEPARMNGQTTTPYGLP